MHLGAGTCDKNHGEDKVLVTHSTSVSKGGRVSRKAKKNPDGTMSIVDHLRELRTRLLRALAAIAVTTIIGFIWYEHGIPAWAIGPLHVPRLPSLGEILKEPYCSLPPSARATFSADKECRLLATSPFEMFMLRMKMGGLAGLVMACPIWLIEIWRFITPGLLKNERRWTLSVGTIAGFLFVLGVVAAYLVLPMGLDVLLHLGDSTQISALTGEKYFNFVIALILVFGLSFEVPLFTAMLNLAGVVHYEQLKDKRRIMIVVIFIFAAIATPGQDPISMLVLALTLVVLMELALQFTRIHDRRVARHVSEWEGLSDDEASPLKVAPSSIPAAESIYDGQRKGVAGGGDAHPAGGSGPIPQPSPVTAPSGTPSASEPPTPTPSPAPSDASPTSDSHHAPPAAALRRGPRSWNDSTGDNDGKPGNDTIQSSSFDDVL